MLRTSYCRECQLKRPDRIRCLMHYESNCPFTHCPSWIPPVEGDDRRRLPVCAEVVGAIAQVYGGLSGPDCGWYGSMSRNTVHTIEKRAVAKMRKEAEGEW